MATTQSPQPVPSVDPEFRKQTSTILTQWEQGKQSYSDTVKALTQLQESARTAGAWMHVGLVENMFGMLHGYRSDLNQSIVHFEQARRYYEQAGAMAQLATIDLNIGESYRLKGNFTRARSYFHRASQTAKRLDRRDTEAVALVNEGQMWLSLKSYNKAKLILMHALNICNSPWKADEDAHDVDNRIGTACEAHHAMVEITLHDGNSDAAWQHAKAAYEGASQTQHSLRLGYANRALGDVMTVMASPPDSNFVNDPDHYYRVALDCFRDIKSEGEVGKTLYRQGRSLAKRGKPRRAAKLYQQAMIIFTKLGMTDDAAKAAEAQLDVL